MPEEEDFEGDNAYVSLLHGCSPQFWLYALLLGSRLKQLDGSRPRVLLVGRDLPGYPSPCLQGHAGLEALWQVRPVDLVDASAADKTRWKRHRYVFTKLLALEVPFRKIVFFDVDVIVRRSPAELFEIPAPAGMYHGPWAERGFARHGQALSAEAFSKAFV